jgi:hypothetical protein
MKRLFLIIALFLAVSIYAEKITTIETNKLRIKALSATPTVNPPAGAQFIYPKSDGFWYGLDDAGLETRLSPYIISATAPLDITANVLSIPAATTSANGYLTSADWNTFYGKQDALGFTAENIINKVTSISGASTATQYPSAKLVYDQLALKAPLANPVFTGSISTPIIKPAADSADAVKVTKADGTTVLFSFNTLTGTMSAHYTLNVGGNLRTAAVLYAETFAPNSGTSIDTYPLVFVAGTATAGTGPLKFTLTGAVLNTTPEPGMLEPDDDGNLYFTNAAATRNEIVLTAFTGDSGSGGSLGYVPAPAAGDGAAGKVLYADGTWSVPPGASGGEANTSSNTGSAGVGIYKQKSGVDLQLYKLLGSDAISIALNGTDYIDVKLNITGLSASTTPASGDYFVMYDATSGSYKKVDTDNMPSTGDVVGPGSATANAVALFDGTTGKLLKNGYVLGTSANNIVQLNGSAKLPAVDGSQLTKMPFEYGIAISDETTDLTTGTAKVTFRMPCGITLTEVRASVTTAPTGSVITVDINESGSTILSTKLSIDATEKTSTTAATAAVISDSALADDAEITIDIDGIGSTVAGNGLKILLKGTR